MDLSDSITDYDYDLPQELIAQRPAMERESAKLLVVRCNPTKGMPQFEDLLVSDLPQLLGTEPSLKNSLWIRNRSAVFPARFYARRPSGGKHEVLLIEKKSTGLWEALVRGQSHFHYPQELIEEKSGHRFLAVAPGMVNLSPLGNQNEMSWLREVGEMPLPPYIQERIPSEDHDRYQPVWARSDEAKSSAAPTASLHFTTDLVERMEKAGARFVDLLLHVGLGTFEPVRQAQLSHVDLHAENLEVSHESVELLERSALAPRIAVGTTALRCLESLPLFGKPTHPQAQLNAKDGGWSGATKLFVKPGFEFRYTNALWTNFHLPKSTLLVLVATFAGSRNLVLSAYKRAVSKRYRFFSYGDASIWLPH